jgi:glycosyltransferase involved in cell wall biosynthesis
VITLSPDLNAFPANLPYRVVVENPVFGNKLDMKYVLTLNLYRILRKYENEVDIYHIWGPLLLLGGIVYRMLRGKKHVVAYLNNVYFFCTQPDLINAECYKHCGLMSQIKHRRENLVSKALSLPFRAFEHFIRISSINKLDAFIAPSPLVAEVYLSQHVEQSKIFMIPAGIDYAQLRNLKQNHTLTTFASDRYHILYVGRLSPGKGIDILIHAVSRLEFPLILHILGDGPRRNELELLSAELGVSDRVIFHGWVSYDRVIDFYLNSQLLIHPARWPEALSRTILDAMALGLPVVAADCESSAWELKDAGLCFQTEDVNDLIDKIRQMYENSSLAADLARKAEKRAEEFDYRRLIPKLVEVYETLTDGVAQSRTGDHTSPNWKTSQRAPGSGKENS